MKKKCSKKKIFKWFTLLKLPFTIYLLISLLIVPELNDVSANLVQGAHRGASVDYEENTIEAFEAALNNPKYSYIEFDIQYSLDEEIVVIHQNNKYRFAKNFIYVSETNYEDIDAAFEFHVPLYGEVMAILAGKKPLNIEIKSSKNIDKDKKLADFVIADCKEKGIINQVMISAVSSDIVEYIEEKYPEVKSGQVHWVTLESIIPINDICNDVYDTPADYVLLHGYTIHNYETLIECKPDDKTLIFWYFTDEAYIVDDGNSCEFWETC